MTICELPVVARVCSRAQGAAGRIRFLFRLRCALMALTVPVSLFASSPVFAHPSYDEAMELIGEYRYVVAMPLLREAAESNHQAAQRTLGFMLLAGEAEYGPGVHADRDEAMRWFSRAAASGCDVSARMVGRLAAGNAAPIAAAPRDQ